MDVTVCICTRDRPGYVRDCLGGLSRQTVAADQFDILVVDSASTGDVPEQLERMVALIDNARLLRVEQPGVAIARNAGAREANGAYVAYTDDDAIPAPDWVARILDALCQTFCDAKPPLDSGEQQSATIGCQAATVLLASRHVPESSDPSATRRLDVCRRQTVLYHERTDVSNSG